MELGLGFGEVAPPLRRYYLKVLVLGDAGVGKTALLEQFVNRRFVGSYKATIGCDFLVKEMRVGDAQVTMQLWDTAGQERYQSLGSSYYKGADAVLLVFDRTTPASLSRIGTWKEEFLLQGGVSLPETFPFCVVGNKSDLDTKVSTAEAEAWCVDNCIPCRYLDVSARDGSNIALAFREIATAAIARPCPSPARAMRAAAKSIVVSHTPKDAGSESSCC